MLYKCTPLSHLRRHANLGEALGRHLQEAQCRTPVISYAGAGIASPDESLSPLGCSSWALPTSPASLSSDAQGVLSIIHAVGGTAPEALFGHAVSWNEDGEPALVDVPVPRLLTERRGSAAVNELLRHQLLLVVDAGFMAINPRTAPSLQYSSTWKLPALQAVCNSFPRYPDQVLW